MAGRLGSVEHLNEFEVPIHHPVKVARLGLDHENAKFEDRGHRTIPDDQIFGVAGDDSEYSKIL